MVLKHKKSHDTSSSGYACFRTFLLSCKLWLKALEFESRYEYTRLSLSYAPSIAPPGKLQSFSQDMYFQMTQFDPSLILRTLEVSHVNQVIFHINQRVETACQSHSLFSQGLLSDCNLSLLISRFLSYQDLLVLGWCGTSTRGAYQMGLLRWFHHHLTWARIQRVHFAATPSTHLLLPEFLSRVFALFLPLGEFDREFQEQREVFVVRKTNFT